MRNGKQAIFKRSKDLHFPKDCGSLYPAHKNKIQISPLARSFSLAPIDLVNDSELEHLTTIVNTVKRQINDANSQLDDGRVRKTGRKNDGSYYPDYSGRFEIYFYFDTSNEL
jgi:hypothetical protein